MTLTRYVQFALLAFLLMLGIPLGASVATAAAPFVEALRGDEVRVVLGELRSPTVEASHGARIYLDDARHAWLELETATQVDITPRGKRLRVTIGRTTRDASHIAIESPDGHASRYGTTRYRGTLEFTTDRAGKLQVVNRVPLEEYVAAVVASEYGLNDIEGARAMAIVARTYALAVMDAGGILRDDERSQVYRGEHQLTAAAIDAARSTAGLILTHGGKPIEAVYSSSNGGHTAANANVWDSEPLPYLVGRKDTFDSVSPHTSWTFDIDKQALHRLFGVKYGMDVDRVDVADTSDDGRVRRVVLSAQGGGDRVITGTAFRAVIADYYGASSARSTRFRLSEQNGAYRLEGGGFGHGVGLSQFGAHGRALAGHSFQDILDFYYPSTRLERLDSAADLAALLEMPVLARLTEPSEAPSKEGSGVNPIPQEKSSTFSSGTSERATSRVIDAHAAWGRVPAQADTTAPRRRGW